MNLTLTASSGLKLRSSLMLGALLSGSLMLPISAHAATKACSDLLKVEKRLLDSEESKTLCDYQGKVILVVNTASKCGFTPQYEGLEKLYAEYKDQGLVVLGFPSNDFMGQEPGTEQQIATFCKLTYGVKFPMFEKTKVKKGTDDPFYQGLAKAADDTYPKWNFYKYLIDRDGKMVDVYSSLTKPEDEDLVAKIKSLLKQPAPNAQAAAAD
jgi:glutathione peroxidase